MPVKLRNHMLSKANTGHGSSSLLPPLPMRDFASCFSDHAVRVAGTGCRSGGGASGPERAHQNAVTSLYRAVLSTGKVLVIKVGWCRDASLGGVASVEIEDGSARSEGSGPNCHHLRKKKGSRSFDTGKSVVSLHWDVSAAKYASGPEPVKDFYLIVVADGEFGLLLGDACEDFIRKFADRVPIAASALFGRRERVHGGASLYSTRAQFLCDGKEHEISIRCRGDDWDAEHAELYVCVDKKRMVDVRRVKWNFRGNQTIFVDDKAVDVMWDVHSWWFGGASGAALFMFRTRSSVESRLWLVDEELAHRTTPGFSLLIEAFKNQ